MALRRIKGSGIVEDYLSNLETDMALLGFRVAANGSLAKYNLVDQIIDGFEDDSGVDGTSTDATVDPVNNYISGRPITAHDPYATYAVADSQNSIDSSTPRIMTIGTYGIGNYVVGNANIGTSGLDYISNGSGYDISYIVTDDTPGSGGSFRPGFKTNYSTSFSDSYYYQYWSTYFSVGDTIKTNLLSNGSTATITWYHKPSGASTFDQLSQTTGLSITDWYVWVSGWCDSGDIKASYTAEYTGAPTDMTLISTATTAEATPTTGDIVMTYTNGAGTATVNTDLKAWISRDNGSTYTQATLSSEGTTGGHTILTAHNVDISSQPSGTSMRYKITTHNQSESKETRIQAVSLGWG